MVTEKITIYRIDQPPLEVDPSRCIFTDRTRIEEGACPRKRYLRYELGGLGYVTQGSNEDIVIGSATHAGLASLLQGGSLEQSLQVAEDYFWENINHSNSLLPEQTESLGWDGCNLARAFTYGYNSAYLQDLLNDFEVIEIEEEINWLMGQLDDPIDGGDLLVMMSRPDGILRKRDSGKLWHVSHKTSQQFLPLTIDKFKMDTQRFSESMAIWAKYGEIPEGTIYNYFLKGKRYSDRDLNVDRFSSGLIHPYLNRKAYIGDLTPELLQFGYEWQELIGHELRTKRLGTGWERSTIYLEMDFLTYLQWLEQHVVPRGKDYFKESIISNVEYFEPEFAERWLRGLTYSERDWAIRVDFMKGLDGCTTENKHLDREIPLQHSQCFDWGKKCSYYQLCWEHNDPAQLIEQGILTPREPNHPIELTKIRQGTLDF